MINDKVKMDWNLFQEEFPWFFGNKEEIWCLFEFMQSDTLMKKNPQEIAWRRW